MNTPSFLLRRWWLAANRAGLEGGRLALKAYFFSAGASVVGAQTGLEINALTLQQGACVFALAFAYNFLTVPLPDLEAETTQSPIPPAPPKAPSEIMATANPAIPAPRQS